MTVSLGVFGPRPAIAAPTLTAVEPSVHRHRPPPHNL